MNGTFISIEPTGTEVRYLAGIRNRGAGSRDQQPNNYRVSVPGDRPWKDVTYLAINARYSMEEIAGSALFRQAGLPALDAVPVQVRVNNANLAVQNLDMFGSYVWMEAEGDAFASNHFPNDDDGNYYRGVRRYTTNEDRADLTYHGEDEDLYRLDYEKQTNEEADDYTDIIALTRAFDPVQTPGDAAFAAALSQLIDVDQWLRYFAATVMIGDMETTLATGYGDDYSLYRGEDDPRFRIIVHDLDTILGRGDAGANPQRGIFMAAASPAIDRFLKSPTFAPMFYAQLVDLVGTTFDPANLKQTLSNALGSYVPADVIDLMRDFAQDRKTYVLSQIPRTLTAASALAVQNNYPRTTLDVVNLFGQADVVNTRSVLVNGQRANWVAWQGTWALNGVALQPGVNRIVVQAMDGDGKEVARTTYDVWRDVLPGTVGGTLAAGTTTWTAAGGPYHVTSDLLVPAGSTLVIEPGTTVYINPGVRISVLGTLDARGTADKRIRFTRMPGSTGGWNGIALDYVTALPTAQRQDNRIAYADFEYGDGGGEAILADKANLYLDNLIFSNHTKQYIDVTDSSVIISNSYFPGISTAELIHFSGFPSDGYALVRGNTFGVTTGYNDIIDFTGGQRPGPIAQFLDNTFLGGSAAEPGRLDQLGAQHVGTHLEERRVEHHRRARGRERRAVGAAPRAGERERTFREPVDLALEAFERAQRGDHLRPLGERGAEQRMLAQEVELARIDVHLRRVLQDLPQAREHHVVAVLRQFAEEERHGRLVDQATRVGMRHQRGELVGIHPHRLDAHLRTSLDFMSRTPARAKSASTVTRLSGSTGRVRSSSTITSKPSAAASSAVQRTQKSRARPHT
jgi:hypothetical protein